MNKYSNCVPTSRNDYEVLPQISSGWWHCVHEELSYKRNY